MSIKINKALISIISNIPELAENIGNKIYPIIAPKGVVLPYITIIRDGSNSEYTKDKTGFDNIHSIIEIQSKSYSESVDIAEIIKEYLEDTRGIIEGININQIRRIDDDEDYIIDKDKNDAYQQVIVFNIKVQ